MIHSNKILRTEFELDLFLQKVAYKLYIVDNREFEAMKELMFSLVKWWSVHASVWHSIKHYMYINKGVSKK